MDSLNTSRRSAAAAMVAGLVGTALVASAAQAQDRDRDRDDRGGGERHPSLRRAMDALEEAKQDLMRANHDFGGHRRATIDAIDRAEEQLRVAMQFDRR
jgi:hypothetical protein